MEFMISQKGKSLIKYDGYKFHKTIETEDGWKWRCTQKTCNSKIYLLDDGKTITKTDICHNHEPEKNIQRQEVSNRLKRKATEQVAEIPMKIIRREITNMPLDVTENLNRQDMGLIRQNIYRARRKLIPSFPKNIDEVHQALSSRDIKTYRGENLLQVNDSNKNIVCFATESNIKTLSEHEQIFVDGTFQSCPKYFFQLFIIHAVVNGNYSPLIFFLLPDKTASSYENAFMIIIDLCEKKNIIFNPKIVVADFEKAIHISATKVWPKVRMVGCRFHLTQAWWRKIQEIGLVTEYRDKKSELGKWLHLFFALPFLDPAEVSDAFVENIMAEQPNDPRIVAFTDYITDTYISEEAVYPPFVWASPSVKSERTTNACESFHSHFNCNFNSTHPNIYAFIEVLKAVHVDIYVWRNTAYPKRVTNQKYKKRMDIMMGLLHQYEEKKITRNYFLKCMAYHCTKK